MYKELEKYKTGKVVDGTGVIANINPPIEFPIKQNQYHYPLGDLISDFIKHEKKPWYRRNFYHKHLTKLYRDILNTITLEHNFSI